MNKTIIWKIEIFPRDTDVYGSMSILDTQSDEYQAFVDDIYGAFDRCGFDLYDSYESPYAKNGSQSEYFQFVKFNKARDLFKILVEVRSSDHKIQDKSQTNPKLSGNQVHISNLNKRAEAIAKEWDMPPIPVVRFVEVIFDGQHFMSYDVAADYIEHKIKTISDKYE